MVWILHAGGEGERRKKTQGGATARKRLFKHAFMETLGAIKQKMLGFGFFCCNILRTVQWLCGSRLETLNKEQSQNSKTEIHYKAQKVEMSSNTKKKPQKTLSERQKLLRINWHLYISLLSIHLEEL